MRKRLILVLGIVATMLMVAVAAQTDITGEWSMTFDTDQGSRTATLKLEQDGETVTGELASDQGAVEFEGTIVGNKLEWLIEVDAGGAFIEIAMDGTVDGDEMMGSADFGGYGGGDWTATRQ
ncbi:MAG: hypothetical protein QF681_15160 [Vicinamibacterales bacterium]|nr:hypothetical protein [Vicinamibacterales bacterium]